ncbi:MAG TPA: hypothetical protein DCG12_22460, partial [Planctomycetaceae bacterium]|nr:hypothetical protein [Planctomycetaceae bacterium]
MTTGVSDNRAHSDAYTYAQDGSMKLLVLLLLSALPISQPPPENLVDSINQERGGRHWIDQKTAPPLSPAESLARFKIEPTSRIQLVASEPLV